VIYIVQNALPIALATLSGLLVGALYHRLAGADGHPPVVTALLAEGWLCAILAGALILAPAKADPWVMAVGTAVVIWAGFVAPVVAVTLRYRRVPVSGVVRVCLHWLAVMAVQAVVLKVVGLTPPPA